MPGNLGDGGTDGSSVSLCLVFDLSHPSSTSFQSIVMFHKFFWCDQDNRNHPPVLLCRDDELASFSWCSGFAFSLISFDAPWCSWCTGCRYQGPLPPHTPTSPPIPLGSGLWVLPFGKLWHLQIRPATLSDVAKSELIFLFMVGAKKPARHH